MKLERFRGILWGHGLIANGRLRREVFGFIHSRAAVGVEEEESLERHLLLPMRSAHRVQKPLS